MGPIDHLKAELGEEIWRRFFPKMARERRLKPVESLSPFHSLKTYVFGGRDREFDFPTLPFGSFCVYVADENKAVRLTREGKEIQTILGENWAELPECDPVKLADLVLLFYHRGKYTSHAVLPNGEAIKSFGRIYAHDLYVVDERKLNKVRDAIGDTCIAVRDDTCTIRAVTLYGWMHDKRNLGIEHIHVSKSGGVRLDRRKVISRRIFRSIPDISY